MDFISRLSPTLWDLFQRTRLRPDVALELFDEALVPQFSPSEDPRILALRGAASIRFLAGSELSFGTVLQRGREARLALDQWELTLLPIRDSSQPVGLLAAIMPREVNGQWAGPGPGEAAARAWRDALEGDLIASRRLATQEQLTSRSRALASFVADLQQFSSESDLLNGLLQAIAVWHDVEPCAYARDLAGNFTLRATLPGTDSATLPASLDAGAVIETTADRTDEWPILTQMAWRGRGSPLLVVVSAGSLEEWLIALTGSRETDIVRQLNPLLRGFAAGMERVREREGRKLREQVWDAIGDATNAADLPEVGRGVLTALCRAVNATQGLLTIASATGEGTSPEAASGEGQIVQDGYFTADVLSVRYPLADKRTGSLELRRSDGGAFHASDVTAVLAARSLVGAWLSGLRGTPDWQAGFVAPDQPRVLRFSDPSASAWTR